MTKTEAIIQAFKARLDTVAGVTVFRDREVPVGRDEGLTALLYGQWSDTATPISYGMISWTLLLGVRIIAVGTNSITLADAARGPINAAVMADGTLGGIVEFIRPFSTRGDVADSDGITTAMIEMSYEINYTTTADDLST